MIAVDHHYGDQHNGDHDGPALSPDVVVALSTAGAPRAYRAGALIFAEGDPAGAAFLVTEGEVMLRVGALDGTSLAQVSVGHLVGELSAVDGLPRSASAIAATDVELIAVPPAAFGELLATVPALALHLLRLVAGRLRTSTQRRAAAAGGLPVAHLAQWLLADAGPVSPGERVEIGAARLAAELGVSSEMVSRALDHLAARGALTFERGSVVVLDVATLRHAADPEAK